MRVITFKAEEDFVEKLDSFAREQGLTRSEVIRRAIELYISLKRYRFEPQPKYVRLMS